MEYRKENGIAESASQGSHGHGEPGEVMEF